MSILGKLKFWKKEPLQQESDFNLGLQTPIPGVHEPPFDSHQELPSFEPSGMNPEPSFNQPASFEQKRTFEKQSFSQPSFAQQASQQTFPQTSQDPQLQLISSKLDTIKAQLETVLQRLERLERWKGI